MAFTMKAQILSSYSSETIPAVTNSSHSREVKQDLKYNGVCQKSRHTASHHGRLQAGRRTSKIIRHVPTHHSHLLFLLTILASCCGLAFAQPLVNDYPAKIVAPRKLIAEGRITVADLADVDISGPLLVDTRPPPKAASWQYDSEILTAPDDPYLDHEHYMPEKRGEYDSPISSSSSSAAQDHSTSTPTSASSTTQGTDKSTSTPTPSTSSASSSATGASSSTSGNLATGTADANTPLPSPFDSSLGNNFTTKSCPQFITSFLQEPTFKSCLPFSLLLQNSNSFFQAEKSIVRITQVLDATCSAPPSTCSTYLSSLAVNLTSSSACAAEFADENPTVLQAHTGLLAYLPLYSASCLKNPTTHSYCFADAVTNSSSITDSYVYFLPLNMSLPASSQPTCDKCLQNTMAVFNSAAANRSLAIASTYGAAAGQINIQCGPGFVNGSIPASISSAKGRDVVGANAGMLVLAMMILSLWL